MKLFGKDLADEIVVVAEIGVNHEGDLKSARRLIGLAADAGADAVKFQTYTPERYASASDPERLARVTAFALGREDMYALKEVADSLGIGFFSTALTEDCVQHLTELSDVIKVASGDLDFEPVIRSAAASGATMILSTGLGTLEEIDRAVNWVRSEIGDGELSERLILMQCVSAYPTPIDEAGVHAITVLRDRYQVPVGYSNHVIGPHACYAAVALGAPIVEVHFTDRKAGRSFRDHALSMEPDELSSLVATLPRIRASLGPAEKRRQPSEQPLLAAMRKGVVAARDLSAGVRLRREDLMFARPAVEFRASEISRLLGQRLTTGFKRGETISRAAVEEST